MHNHLDVARPVAWLFVCYDSNPYLPCVRLEDDDAKKPAVPPGRTVSASGGAPAAAAGAGGRPSTAGSGPPPVATQAQPGQLGRENSSGTPRSAAASGQVRVPWQTLSFLCCKAGATCPNPVSRIASLMLTYSATFSHNFCCSA